jgi:hypothetical protein
VINIIDPCNEEHLFEEHYKLPLNIETKIDLIMKTKVEIQMELNKLLKIVDEATGIYRADCPELETKIAALQWVLGVKNEAGKLIQLEVMLLG